MGERKKSRRVPKETGDCCSSGRVTNEKKMKKRATSTEGGRGGSCFGRSRMEHQVGDRGSTEKKCNSEKNALQYFWGKNCQKTLRKRNNPLGPEEELVRKEGRLQTYPAETSHISQKKKKKNRETQNENPCRLKRQQKRNIKQA